jgi:hypothetical protein
LREEHWLRVLRKIFGPERDEVTGNCIRGDSWYVLFTKYYLGDHTKLKMMGRACGTYG